MILYTLNFKSKETDGVLVTIRYKPHPLKTLHTDFLSSPLFTIELSTASTRVYVYGWKEYV